ncbi:MAG: hypothetical protein KH347_02690 [Acetobacter sp.]|nr:hypothetical protein [Acetobacter sp.]
MTFKGTNESGRSMIEMLGVLAIIGVLSVGGIAGYSQAMFCLARRTIKNTFRLLTMACRKTPAFVSRWLTGVIRLRV